MSELKIVVAIYDSTTARCLQPIAESLATKVDVEYLLLDELLPRSAMDSELSVDDFEPNRRASNYVNSDILQRQNEVDRTHPFVTVMFQRLIEDNISPELTYDISGYLADSDPDVFICGHDLLPFLKHIIKQSHSSDFKSVVVQHGINRPDLENPSSLPGIPDVLSPDVEPNNWLFEYVKRRIGFKYGAFLFCNPYVDEIYTLGEFFSDHIRDLREGYPCFGKTEIITTGSTEYNPTSIQSYDSEISSVLFLSQWQYEHDIWSTEQQSYIVERLAQVEKESEVPVTIRPHPKDSEGKINRFFKDFDISDKEDLSADVDSHDAILTVDSTAIFSGVIAGKVCGVIQTPWNEIRLRPFTHNHIVEVTPSQASLGTAGMERSQESQKSYLRECCYVPDLEKDEEAASPVDLVTSKIID